jgi:hypothetical protein
VSKFEKFRDEERALGTEADRLRLERFLDVSEPLGGLEIFACREFNVHGNSSFSGPCR